MNITAYVDGSYYADKHRYGFGCVLIEPNQMITLAGGSHNYKKVSNHRNVTGEILGSVYAVIQAVKLGYTHIDIYYDYLGIEMWATKKWKRNYPLTEDYCKFMSEASKYIDIAFHKVKGHSGDMFNDKADLIAKEAVTNKVPMPIFDIDIIIKDAKKSLPTLVSSFLLIPHAISGSNKFPCYIRIKIWRI